LPILRPEIHGVPLSDNDVDKVVVTAGGQQAMTTGLDLSISIDDLKEKVNEGAIFYISMPNNPTGYASPSDLPVKHSQSNSDSSRKFIFDILCASSSNYKYRLILCS